jgi:hypothetical protein
VDRVLTPDQGRGGECYLAFGCTSPYFATLKRKWQISPSSTS